MTSKVYWTYESSTNGKLGIMARPRGGQWLDEEIANLSKLKVDILVSLLEKHEITELDLHSELLLCQNHNIEFLNIPIADRSVPEISKSFNNSMIDLKNKINLGKNIVVHCRMGIGRSSIIAGAIQMTPGNKADTILNNISKIRGLKVPDTEEQTKWLRNRE